MVEVMLVLVEATDDDGQIPTLVTILRGVAVHNPLVARGGDGHGSRRLQIVYVEGHLLVGIDVTL